MVRVRWWLDTSCVGSVRNYVSGRVDEACHCLTVYQEDGIEDGWNRGWME